MQRYVILIAHCISLLFSSGMRVGDKRKLTIPPSMGYGDKRVGSIPQNSWLVFDVELVGVEGR